MSKNLNTVQYFAKIIKWLQIAEWVSKQNLQLTISKVKAHSTDINNNQADSLARNGLTNPSFILTPDSIKLNSSHSPRFSEKCIIIEENPRKFVIQTQQAQFFEQF